MLPLKNKSKNCASVSLSFSLLRKRLILALKLLPRILYLGEALCSDLGILNAESC
jgi:hypothetical protein